MNEPAFEWRLAVLLACIVVAAGSTGCATVGPGRIGVLWRASGGTQPQTYGEGLYSIAPWNELSVYDLRSMNHDEVLQVIAVNGLGIKLDASVRYHLNSNEVVALQREIGPDYYTKVLEPVLRLEAAASSGGTRRKRFFRRSAKSSSARSAKDWRPRSKASTRLEAILIRDVELPEAIRKAIDQKLAAEQEVLKMKYVLEVSKATADERRIDAQGIADYNHTVATS